EHEKVVFEVARAYFHVNAARAQVAVRRDTLERTRVIAAAAEARYGQGLATTVDLAEVKRDVAQGEFDLAHAQAAEVAADAGLVMAVGIDPQVHIGVSAAASGSLPARLARPLAEYIEEALTTRADLRAASARLPATDAAVARSISTYVPRVSLVATGGDAWLGA